MGVKRGRGWGTGVLCTLAAACGNTGGFAADAQRLPPHHERLYTASARSAFKIDADFPGGNVIVLAVDGDKVSLQPDARGKGQWFYWAFRIRGAEGRTLDFEFPKGPSVGNGPVGARGPAVSHDGGVTWRWLSDTPGFARTAFRYAFGAGEKDVLFSVGMNYTEKDLNRFLEKHKGNPDLKVGTLCKSRKGRDVELIRIPGKGDGAEFKLFFVSRHHSCEMMATRVLEGIMEAALSDSDDGRWLRGHCDFFIVPFADKDGVEEGDHGKNRKPYDHNRDYHETRRIYPEVRAITEQVPVWQNGRPMIFMDMHCPVLRNREGGESDWQESVFFYSPAAERSAAALKRFCTILEAERKGPIPHREEFNMLFGTAANKPDGLEPTRCNRWGGTLPGVIFEASLEVPYANALGVAVDADSSRALGCDFARAIRVYLETLLSNHGEETNEGRR